MKTNSNPTAAGSVPSPLEAIPHLESGELLRVLMLSAGELLLRSIKTAYTWSARAKQRRDLLMLNDHLLKDIGITREQARFEADQPFWKA